ncbi:MAG: aspartate/glutamate racemase family protein [Pseudomonadota bacterium]
MIVLINPNSTETMTLSMKDTASKAVPGARIVAWTSHDGPAAIEGPEDGEACVPPLLELVGKASDDGAKAIIIGCADDTGLAPARRLASCPVIGIGQAAYHMAVLAGEKFSVVTTLPVSIPVLEANIAEYGLSGSLSRVRASNVPVLDLETDKEAATARVLAEAGRAAREDDIQSVVLGCAGMSHIPCVAPSHTIRLIDGVTAAAKIVSVLA